MLRKNNNQKGVAIFLSLIIMTISLAISLGLTIILLGQIRVAREAGYSGVAFYASDSGIEEMFYQDMVCWKQNCDTSGFNCLIDGADCKGLIPGTVISVILDNGATATTTFTVDSGVGTINSVGFYEGVQRAIEAHY